jgi:membrane protein implicated in regulation of membrane protease activity
MTILWLFLAFTFLTIELLSPGLFFFLALALGSSCTFAASCLDITTVHPYALFFISSAVMFIILKCTVTRLQHAKHGKFYQSNTDLLIGQVVEISEVTSQATGYAKIAGDRWQVTLQDNPPLKLGMHVRIVSIKGCHLIVKHCFSN